MTDKQFGKPVEKNLPSKITLNSHSEPSLKWVVSDKARKEIEEIEANIRTAEQRSGHRIFG